MNNEGFVGGGGGGGGYSIVSGDDPRLKDIPGDFKSSKGFSLEKAKMFNAYDHYDSIYKEWMELNDWNMNIIRQHEKAVTNQPPKPSYLPQSQKWREEEVQRLYQKEELEKIEAQKKAALSEQEEQNKNRIEIERKLIEGMKRIEFREYTGKGRPLTIRERNIQKKLENKPIFDPEINARSMEELYPELSQMRDDAFSRMVRMRKTLEELNPKFRMLLKHSNKIFNSYIGDIHRHLQTVVLDHDFLKTEILKAEKEFSDSIIAREKRLYESEPGKDVGTWGKIMDVFSMMFSTMNAADQHHDLPLDEHEHKLRKSLEKTMTEKMIERERKASEILQELTETGVMDILQRVNEDGTAFLMNIENYETKKRNLYAKLVEHVEHRDKEKLEMIQQRILDFQEFLLDDLKDINARTDEYKLLSDVLKATIGLKEKPQEMSWVDWEKNLSESRKMIEEKRKRQKEDLLGNLKTYQTPWYQNAQDFTYKEMFDMWWRNEEYPGHFKRIYEEKLQDYEERIKGEYKPGKLKRAWIGIQEIADGLMKMVPQVLATIPGMGKLSWGVTKTAQIVNIIINNSVTRAGIEFSKSALGGTAKFLWKHKMMVIQLLAGMDPLTVGGSMAAIMMFKLGDMMLLKLLNKGLGYIPGYDPIYLNGAIEFAGADQTTKWKYLQDGLSKIERKSQGATNAVFSGMKRYLPLALRLKNTSKYAEVIKSSAYREQRMMDHRILTDMANMNQYQMERYNPGNIFKPKEGSYTAESLQGDGFANAADGLLYHLIQHNRSNFKTPMEAWKKTFQDKAFSAALFDSNLEDSTKLGFDTGNAAMTKIKKEANERAAFEVKAILKEITNREGIPTISEMKKYIQTYSSDLRTINREQLAIESELDYATRHRNSELVDKFSEKLLPLMERKYKLLYKTSFFKELGLIAQNNHDTISRLSQLATVFTSEHKDLYSLIPPLAPNAQQLMEQHWNSDTVNAWQFKDILQKLHQQQISQKGNGQYEYSTIAAMIAEKAKGMDKDITETGEYTLFNLSELAAATTQGRYLEDVNRSGSSGAILGVVNLVTNLTKTMLNKGYETVVGGMLGTVAPTAIANAMFAVVPLVVSGGFVWTAFSAPFMSSTVRSMLTAQLFSSGVVVPLAEWLYGETYSQMMNRSSKYKKASLELDQKAAETFTLHKRRWDLERRNKLEAAFSKKLKYQAGLSRAGRTFSSTKERLERFSASDKIKKLQAAENRLIAEEVQYEQLLNEIEKEISDLEAQKYTLPEKDDLIPGYTDLKKQYEKEVSSRSWGLTIIEHATNIPQYIQWLALVQGYASILSNPWRYGKVADSTGQERWMFPAPIHQLQSAYQAMDESLGIDQSTENSLYEIYENVNGEVNIPPSEYLFKFGATQSTFPEIENVDDAMKLVNQQVDEYGKDFIKQNFVMVDTKTFKVYEDPLRLIDFAMTLRRRGLPMGESQTLDLLQPFPLIPDTPFTREMLSIGTSDASLFDENQPWSTAIDEVYVRLMPKALFEGVPGTGIGIPKELSVFYKTLLHPYDAAKYGGIYDVLLSRIDASKLQFLVTSDKMGEVPETAQLRNVFPEFGETGYLLSGGLTNPKMVSMAQDTDWYIQKVLGHYSELEKKSNVPISSPFALQGMKPGAPFSEEELRKMTIFDMDTFTEALRKKYGVDFFRSKQERTEIASFIQERSVVDLVSTLNREKALYEASVDDYAKAWANFAWAWFYSGIQYRVAAFTDVSSMVGKGLSSWIEGAQTDETGENIKKLEAVKESLMKASELFTKVLVSAEGAHLNAHRPQPKNSDHDQILEAINMAYGLFKNPQGYVDFGKGHKLVAPLEKITPNTPIQFYLDKLGAISKARESDLRSIRSSENITIMAKIFTALGHDLITKMVGTLQIYFESYESVYNKVFPSDSALDWFTQVPAEYRSGVYNYIVGPVYTLLYLGTDILMHYGVGGFQEKLQEAENSYYNGGEMEQFYKNLATTKIPTLGETREDLLPSGYQPYDLKAILEETRTDRFFQFVMQSIQKTFEFTWSLANLDVNNPVVKPLLMTANFIGYSITKTVSYANGVSESLDYITKWMGAPERGMGPDKVVDGVLIVDFSPEALEKKGAVYSLIQAFGFMASDGGLGFRRTMGDPPPTPKSDEIPYGEGTTGGMNIDVMLQSEDPAIQKLAAQMLSKRNITINQDYEKMDMTVVDQMNQVHKNKTMIKTTKK